MAGYIGSKTSVTQVDGYNRTEADAEFVNDPNSVITVSGSNVGIGTSSPRSSLDIDGGVDTHIRMQTNNTGTSSSDGLLLGLDGSTNALAYFWNYENAPVIIGTNNTARMTIDSSGRVTMPYQPAFLAYSSTYTASGFYPFTSFSLPSTGGFNQGNHFNLSTGVFTVPVSGLYQINYIFHDNLNTTTRKIGRIFLNNLAVSYGEVSEANAIYSDVGGGLVLNLSANDAVQWATHPLAWGSVTASAFLIG